MHQVMKKFASSRLCENTISREDAKAQKKSQTIGIAPNALNLILNNE
jgi:hypothetical protein